jgi:hypothetical protein
MPEMIVNLLYMALYVAIFLALLGVAFRESANRRRQQQVLQAGVEVEAEVLARFEAGEIQGGKPPSTHQGVTASWDPLELELRYVVDGREIVSRGRVSVGTFFRARSRKTLRIKVSPDQPEVWAALA